LQESQMLLILLHKNYQTKEVANSLKLNSKYLMAIFFLYAFGLACLLGLDLAHHNMIHLDILRIILPLPKYTTLIVGLTSAEIFLRLQACMPKNNYRRATFIYIRDFIY